jgi:N-sulfoglucosamine sulfohydrolase
MGQSARLGRLLCLGATALLCAPAEARQAVSSAPGRNVVLLIADDHGRDALGAYGNPAVKTPHLDRLAAEGVRFTRAYATTASCSPSRSVILTGLHTHTSGQYGLAHAAHNQHTFEWVRSLPALLRGTHRTGIIGKDHVKPDSVYPFEVRLTAGFLGNRDVAAMADEARKFFSAPDARPFFLVVGFADPHRAGNPQNGWRGFANDGAYAGVQRIRYTPAEVRVPAWLPDAPEVRQELAEYYEAISRLDQGVGTVLRALEEAGRASDTLVVYLSDNGPPFPGAKTTLYAAGVHLPLVVRAPGRAGRGRVNDAMVSWVDIAPTILDWTGTAAPRALPGRSLLPVLDQERAPGWDEVHGSHQMHEITMYYPMRSIRTREYTLIWNLAHQLPYPHASDLWHSPTWQGVLRRQDGRLGERSVDAYLHRPEFELYEISSDPHEVRNVAGDPSRRRVLDDLKGRLRRMLEQSNDPWLVESAR